MQGIKVSAVTVTYFSDLALMRSLLLSLEAAAVKLFAEHGYRCEYVIVDNSADDDYFWRLETLCYVFFNTDYLSIHIIKASKNLGFGGGNNLVLDRLDSEFHLVVNPDVMLEQDALCRAIEYLKNNNDVGMVSPRIIDAGFEFAHVIKAYPDCVTLLLRYAEIPMLTKWFAARLGRYACANLTGDSNKDVQLAGGCFLLMRTYLFEKLNGFDDFFFVYFEDFDFSIRISQYAKIAYVPAVRITHMGGHAGRKTLKHHLLFAVSALKFFYRHGWKLW
jgi:GT2 family glycosyltransferase|tara:strand:+ start:2333 stop:3160 length:828 start_codon:yes stop_codon:yes gene_type:complete